MADNSWLTASPVSGSGDLSVSVGGSLWSGRLARSGQLTVSGVTFPDLSCVLNCTQAGSVILESIGESSATVGALVEGYVALQGVSIRSNLASLTFSFVGSDGGSAWVSGIRYSVDGGATLLDSGASIPGDPGATGAYSVAVYVSVAEETSGVSRSGVLTVSDSGQTLEFTITQSAGVKTYGPVEILSLTAADVPASGGSVTSGSVTYQQTYGWNGATSGAGTITSGGSVSWSGGASGISSLGTTVKDRSVVGSPLVVTVALNDQVGSSSVAIYQAANVSTLTGISADTLSYDAIPVLGGSSSPYYSISGSYSYTSGSTSTSVIDSVVRSRMRAATAATKSFAFVAPVAGFTIDSGTGVVSAAETEQTSEKVAQIKMSVEYEGFSSSVTGTCLQPAGSVVYGTPTVALSYATAPAAGGTLSPVLSVTQPWGWNNDTDAGVLSYDLESLPDGSSVNFTTTTTAGTVGSEDGSITVPTKGTTESGVTTYATITCAVVVNGVSGSGTAAVSQAANTKALTDVSIERNGSGALVTSFTAAGGTAYYKPVGVYTYTSTATQTVELDSEVTEDNWSLDQAWGSVAANPTYPWCSVVTINSRGTVIGNSQSAVLKLTVGGLSDSVILTQAGNYVTDLEVNASDPSYTTIGAGATSATPTTSGGWFKFTYSSGATGSAFPDSTFGKMSATTTWSLGSVQNGFTAIDSSTGVLTATNRGSTIGNARTSGIVTRTYSCTWTPTSAYNAEGSKSATSSKTTTCTQAENTITSIEILNTEDASAPVISVPASQSVYGYTLRCNYSSGSTGSSVLPQSIINWSFDQTWGSLRDNEGSLRYYIYIEFSSRGTTIGSERSGTLSCIVNGEVNGVSINKTDSLTITQAANQVESIKIGGNSGDSTVWGDPKIDVACTENEWWSYSCWATYSSNATKSILASDFTLTSNQSWATVSTGNANWLKRVDFASRGTTVGDARSVILTANYSGKSAIVSVTQEANIIESEIIEVDSFVYSKTIPYTGGTSTPSLSVDSIKTYSSEATSRSGVTNYTKVFSSSNLPDGFSLNTSNGVVTGENYTGSTERSASIKVDVSYTNTLGSVVTASKTATVVQGEADIVYSDPVITFTYLEALASGGTLTPTLSVTQTWGYGQTTGGGSNTYNINTLPVGSYKITGTGVTPTDKGIVTISSLGTTIKPRTKLGSVLISVTLNGKTSSKSTDVYQEANTRALTSVEIRQNGGGADLTTQFSAAGGSGYYAPYGTYTYTSGSTKWGELDTQTTLSSWSIDQSWITLSAHPTYGWTVIANAANRGTTAGNQRTAILKLSVGNLSDSITLTQEANEQKQTACSIEIDHDYQDSLGYNNTNVPASGGRVCIVGVRHYSYTSGATSQIEYDSFTLNCNQSWCVSDDASNLTISSRGTVTGSDRSATVYWQDGSFKSNEMTITQKANSVVSYGIPTGRTLSVSDIPASGGTISSGTLGGTITQTRTFSSGASDTITNPTVTSSSYSAGVFNGSLGNTVVPRTKIGTLTYSYVCNGKTGSVSTDVYQQANNETSITYGTPVVVLSVSDIPASGGTVSSGTVTYTQTRVQNYTSGGTKGLSNVTSGGSISYSTAISANSKGTTVSSRTKIGTLTATVVLNDKKGSGVADVYQQANSATYGAVAISGGSVPVIPASGGSVSSMSGISASQTVSFTSGSSRAGSVKIAYSSTVTASSKGISISNQTTAGTLTATATGEGSKTTTKSLTVYQAGNYVTTIKGSVGTFNYPTIGAGATSATPNLSAGFGVLFTFSSGSTSSSTPAATYGSLSVPSSFKLSASQNGFTAVNSSTGVLTATNRGTTIGDARTSGTVTRTLTATWTPTNSYNTAGTKTSTWSTTATCTQAANTLTWNTPTISRTTPVSMPVGGGTNNVATGLTYSQTGQYSSGSPASASSGGSLSYSVVTAKTGFSLSGSIVTATNNTSTSARNGFVVRITLTLNGKTATKDITYNQAAGSKVYGTPSVSLSYQTVAYNVTYADPKISYSQAWTWNGVLGSGGTITSGGSVTYTGTGGTSYPTNSVSGRITWGTNSSTSERSITVTATVTLNGVKGTGAATAKQSGYTGPVDIYITTSFNYATSQIQINFSSAPKDTFFIKFMGYDNFGSIWEYTTGIVPSSSTSVLFSPPGYSITDNFSIYGLGDSEFNISEMPPYETSNARYYWQSTFRFNE